MHLKISGMGFVSHSNTVKDLKTTLERDHNAVLPFPLPFPSSSTCTYATLLLTRDRGVDKPALPQFALHFSFRLNKDFSKRVQFCQSEGWCPVPLVPISISLFLLVPPRSGARPEDSALSARSVVLLLLLLRPAFTGPACELFYVGVSIAETDPCF